MTVTLRTMLEELIDNHRDEDAATIVERIFTVLNGVPTKTITNKGDSK
jgi:hypothetical protein